MTRPDRPYPDLAPGEPHHFGPDAIAAIREALEEPVPYSLTPAAEAALDSPSVRCPYPGADDPERLAQWCGFPDAAAYEAVYAERERDLAEASEAEAEWEAEMEAEAAAAEDPEAGL